MNPHILYQDKDIIVCIKPAGIPTQSGSISMPDMVSILKNYIYVDSGRKLPPYLGLIHRLDQPVEGLLVFAKTPSAAKELSRQLTNNTFGKYYQAVLHGVPPCQESDLENYIVKDRQSNTSHICSRDTKGAKKAQLHYRITETSDSCSLAEITLMTGRHHQIRVQMAHMGTPVVGDLKYGGSTPSPLTLAAKTLQLFACRLEFNHPGTGKHLEFTLDTPVSIKTNLISGGSLPST